MSLSCSLYPKDPDFQELVLMINPELQEGTCLKCFQCSTCPTVRNIMFIRYHVLRYFKRKFTDSWPSLEIFGAYPSTGEGECDQRKTQSQGH